MIEGIYIIESIDLIELLYIDAELLQYTYFGGVDSLLFISVGWIK